MTFALLTLVLSAAPRLVAPGAVAQTTRERVHVFVEAEGAFRLTVNGGEASCTSWHGTLRQSACCTSWQSVRVSG